MSFGPIKSWDDRRACDRKRCIRGRTWVRRIRWLEDAAGRVKLKLEDGETYREVVTPGPGNAATIWDRFKGGQSIDDAVSILATAPPAALRSKRAGEAG